MKLNGNYLENMEQLEQYKCYPWGENLVYVEDNDEECVYCVMNDNLEVVRPFTVVPDIMALLDELRS